jgi:hypothetical protein
MILTRKNRNIRRKYSPRDTLSTKILTWANLGLNPVLCAERPETSRLSPDTA